MNLIPPINAAPVVPLPANGLEPGDNPLVGAEGPIFYDELIAALAKGAGGEGGAELAGSSGEAPSPEGEAPQSDLQGLPAEVTSQLVDQANFSPIVPQQANSATAGVPVPTDERLASGVTLAEGATAEVVKGLPQLAIGATAQQSAGVTSNPQDQKVVAAVDSLPMSEGAISKLKIATDENLKADSKPLMTATVKLESDGAPLMNVAGKAANLSSASDQSVEARSARVSGAISNQSVQDGKASLTSNQLMLSPASADLPDQRSSIPSDIAVPDKASQLVRTESGDAPSQLVKATHSTSQAKGLMSTNVELNVSSPSSLINASGVVDAPSVGSDFGLRAIGTSQSVELGVSASVVLSEDWRGVIPSQSPANRSVISFGDVSEGANPDGSAELSVMSASVQAPTAVEDFGDWRFSVRPNSANPIDNVALPADVSAQLKSVAAPIVKPISNPASDDIRVMTNESDLTLDPSIRSSSKEAVIDPALTESSRIASDRAVDAITSQTASAQSRTSAEGRAYLDSAMPDVSSMTTSREMSSGSSNSIAEKFVSTLLGMSGMQPESAADRTAIEFRQAKTIVAAPHMARWDAAAVQVELVRLVRDGGGQIVMKLTPPDEGSFRIDLSLDPERGVRIFVEGASDSVRTRLEQGAEQLREQFSQMGFNLQLDMHSRREAFGQAADFGFTESGDFRDIDGGRSAAAEAGTDVEVSPAPRRRSIIDESRVYFRA